MKFQTFGNAARDANCLSLDEHRAGYSYLSATMVSTRIARLDAHTRIFSVSHVRT
jgi:hypothetical protein